jgi:hypothetical protein
VRCGLPGPICRLISPVRESGAQFCEEVLQEAGTGEATDVMIVNSQSETIAGPSTSHHRPEVDPTGWPKAVASFCLWISVRKWQQLHWRHIEGNGHLRYCATGRKVAGSVPFDVTGFFS